MKRTHTSDVLKLDDDNAILDYIMSNPVEDYALYTPGSLPAQVLPEVPVLAIQTLSDLHTEAEVLGLSDDDYEQLKLREIDAIKQATDPDNPNISSAISIFTDIISLHPHYASALNNRAQLYQLQSIPYDKAYLDAKQAGNITDATKYTRQANLTRLQALSDLNQGIQLCYKLYPLFSPDGIDNLKKAIDTHTSSTPIIVPRVLIQLLCQRGVLHKVRGNEKLAYSDFKLAASLGSDIAKKELDEFNIIQQTNFDVVNQMMHELSLQIKNDQEQIDKHHENNNQ